MGAVTGGGAARLVHGEGTPERDWQSWAGWRAMAATDLDTLVPVGCRLVVVAPHPDDEVLGAGGLLAMAATAGRTVLVVAVTEGGASHPGSTRWPPPVLTARRAQERQDSLGRLGIPPSAVVGLGLADGAVAAELATLSRSLIKLLDPSDIVVSPWLLDGHPDHEATCAAVVVATAVTGSVHLQVPIWGWHWASPDGGQLPVDRAVALPLPPGVLACKTEAVRCFSSQLGEDPSTGQPPILPAWALRRLLRDREVFFRDDRSSA
jgi:LmbE family N-acetylglucosaminyl deacetylase